eukprot:589192-Amphidinium_carterae.1
MQQNDAGSGADEAVVMANRTLNAFFAWAAFPQAVKRGLVRNFCLQALPSPSGRSGLALPEVTRLENGRKKLELSLANFQEVSDSTIHDIVRGIPPCLQRLCLDCTGCTNVTDRGLQDKKLLGSPPAPQKYTKTTRNKGRT